MSRGFSTILVDPSATGVLDDGPAFVYGKNFGGYTRHKPCMKVAMELAIWHVFESALRCG